jgi:hypothetical protein
MSLQPTRSPIRTWSSSIPFALVHVAALAAFFLPLRWEMVALAVGSYYLRMFGVTAGYHRYFAHRSYKTSRAFQLLLAFLAQTSAQKACSGGPGTTARTTLLGHRERRPLAGAPRLLVGPRRVDPAREVRRDGPGPHQGLRPLPRAAPPQPLQADAAVVYAAAIFASGAWRG